MGKRLRIAILLLVLAFGGSLVFAGFGYDDPTIPHLTRSNQTSSISTFLALIDTPSSYAGEGGNCLKANVGETAVEFGSCTAGAGGDITSVQGDSYITNGSNEGDVKLVFNTTKNNKTIDERIALNPAGFITSFTEADPFWSGNLTANNGTWNSKFNQTYEDAWQFTRNGTFYLDTNPKNYTNKTLLSQFQNDLTFTEPLWSANLTANNNTWNLITNESYVTYINLSNSNVNKSNYWDGLGSPNTTTFEEQVGGILGIKFSWLESFWNAMFGAKTTDNLAQGSTNLYDNKTWNETRANNLYIKNASVANLTTVNTTNFYLNQINGACDVTTSGSWCKNSTGTYIVG